VIIIFGCLSTTMEDMMKIPVKPKIACQTRERILILNPDVSFM
jgi:hypothetical protein